MGAIMAPILVFCNNHGTACRLGWRAKTGITQEEWVLRCRHSEWEGKVWPSGDLWCFGMPVSLRQCACATALFVFRNAFVAQDAPLCRFRLVGHEFIRVALSLKP